MKQILFLLTFIIVTKSINAQKADPWTIYMTPNHVHELLSEYIGDFDMEISMWMAEGKGPEVFKVNSTHKLILGNRFLEMTQTGSMMGMEYSAVSNIGYNTSSKLFSLTTITNMGTGTLYLTGSWDAKNRIAVLKGQMTDPVDNKTLNVRQQISFTDKDNLEIVNFDTYPGQKEKKSIQYKLVRKR